MPNLRKPRTFIPSKYTRCTVAINFTVDLAPSTTISFQYDSHVCTVVPCTLRGMCSKIESKLCAC